VIKSQIDADLKQAMLSGDKQLVEVIRGIRSVILNAEIAAGSRDSGLEDSAIVSLLQKEVKKRGDAIELYQNAGEQERADKERFEQEVISRYLPEMMSDEEVESLVAQVIETMGGNVTKQQMGQVIAEVRKNADGRADGALIARLVQARLA
jgi:uncharacterized protein